MSVIKIHSRLGDYDVRFENIREFLSGLEHSFQQRMYIVDGKVWDLYRKNLLSSIKEEVITLPIAEENKCLKTVEFLYDKLIECSAKRNVALISIGGGITQDITGFLASTLYRGMHWIFVPTTLLAQADSCIGSKTSLNYKGYKNLIGTFYPPTTVCIESGFLQTQSDVDYFSGLGEVVKLFLLGGQTKVKEMTSLLPKLILKDEKALSVSVRKALQIKKNYIENDEFDNGKRNLLNYGHCFGHALETSSDFAVPHGQGVVAGMALANFIARERRLLSSSLEMTIRQELLFPSLKIKLRKKYLDAKIIIEGMKKDKKRTGEGLAVVMMVDGYKAVKLVDITIAEATKAIEELKTLL